MINADSLNHDAGAARRAAPATRPVADARRPQAPDEVVTDVAPFGVLLDTFSRPPGANRARGGAASSFGVFQGGNASGHEQKQAALRDGQASRHADARARYDVDRTGVDVRRSLQAQTRGADAARTEPRAMADQNRAQGLIREALSQQSASPGRPSGEEGLSLDRLGDLARQGDSNAAPAPRTELGDRPAAPLPPGNGSAPQIEQASSVVAPPPSAPSTSPDVAQEIGRTLGASRIGEVESARAPTAPSHAGLGRTGRQASGRNEAPLAGSRAEKNASSPQAGETKNIESTPFDRLVRSIRMQAGAHRSTARMMLDPPELGRVLVDVAMDGDAVEVSVRAETSEARELLQDRVAQLQRALLKQGIEIERFTVVGDWPGEATAADAEGSGRRRDDARTPAPRSRRTVHARDVGPTGASSEGQKNEPRPQNVRNTVAERRIDVRI